jgi:hypothetical protein
VEVLCRAAENQGYKLWDGFKCGWWWLDEPKDMDEGAYRTICERHRDGRVDRLEGWMTASPSGMNWFGCVEEDAEVKAVEADSRENFYNPREYVESLLKKMSPEMARQQIEGKVINVYSGNAYPHFSRTEDMGEYTIGSDYELIVGVDFNVDPGMHAYAMQFRGEDVYVVDKIYIKGGDTPLLCKEIETRYGMEGVTVHPDAAGAQRHTTGTSDHAILREYGFKIQCRSKNPAIKNRVSSVNGRILNAQMERHLFVDKSCRLLRNDLERCAWPDLFKESYKGPLTHPGAALGYAVEYRFPYVQQGFGVKLPRMF